MLEVLALEPKERGNRLGGVLEFKKEGTQQGTVDRMDKKQKC